MAVVSAWGRRCLGPQAVPVLQPPGSIHVWSPKLLTRALSLGSGRRPDTLHLQTGAHRKAASPSSDPSDLPNPNTRRTQAVDEELGGGVVGPRHEQLRGDHAGGQVVDGHVLDALRGQGGGSEGGHTMMRKMPRGAGRSMGFANEREVYYTKAPSAGREGLGRRRMGAGSPGVASRRAGRAWGLRL